MKHPVLIITHQKFLSTPTFESREIVIYVSTPQVKVAKGKLITINEIRRILARRHGASIGCPITTGIFAWVAVHAADEAAEEGKKNITPYWWTLKTGGIINEKYPGGVEIQKKLLEREGHKIIQKDKH